MAAKDSTAIVRQVYEKGIEIRLGEDGRLYFQSVQIGQSVEVMADPKVTYGVRRILYTERLSSGEERTWLLSPAQEILSLELTELSQIATRKGGRIEKAYYGIWYSAGAICNHCQRLAEAYASICRSFASIPIEGIESVVTFQSTSEPYYEFDALVTAARRSYNTMRHLLWHAFGEKYSIPGSFEVVLRHCKRLPPGLTDRLNFSWSQFGEKTRAYRDCIQHYVSVIRSIPLAIMTRLPGGLWSTSCWLPDNPEVRSHDLWSDQQFQFSRRIDALTYGWELTNEIVDVAKAILREVPDEASASQGD